jgi:hypothetical protein
MTSEEWMRDLINNFEEFLDNEQIRNEINAISKSESKRNPL